MEKKRWLSTEIPLWGVITVFLSASVALGGWAISIDRKGDSWESEAAASKKTNESVGRMAWQLELLAKDSAEIKEFVKSMNKLSMDVWILQREVDEIRCHTQGRCGDSQSRKPK